MAIPKIHHNRRKPDHKIMGPSGIKLKQIQFRSYMHDIALYHFQAYHVSLHRFRSVLNRHEHGYVDTLLSFDPLLDKPIPEGDETPVNCIEVGYMPNVFQNSGSALGFRTGNNMVEWLCFDRDIRDILLNKIDIDTTTSDGAYMLFDHVADMPKGIPERRVKGANSEHKGWHDSLGKAQHRPVKLRLNWRKFGTDLKGQHNLQREIHALQRKEKERLDLSDVPFVHREMLTPDDFSECAGEYESYDEGYGKMEVEVEDKNKEHEIADEEDYESYEEGYGEVEEGHAEAEEDCEGYEEGYGEFEQGYGWVEGESEDDEDETGDEDYESSESSSSSDQEERDEEGSEVEYENPESPEGTGELLDEEMIDTSSGRFIYEDNDTDNMNDTPSTQPEQNISPSSSGSVLSDKDTNILITQRPSSIDPKARAEQLLNGGYI